MIRREDLTMPPTKVNASLIIDSAPNGGFVVSVLSDSAAIKPQIIGAFSCVDDLIIAMAAHYGAETPEVKWDICEALPIRAKTPEPNGDAA